MAFSVAFQGLTELVHAYTNRDRLREIGPVLYQEGEVVMTAAKRITPVDTGNLRASGHVRPPTYGPTWVEVELGFGGPAAPYAIYVHENLNANHTVGQAKFLETPFNARLPEVQERLRKMLGS